MCILYFWHEFWLTQIPKHWKSSGIWTHDLSFARRLHSISSVWALAPDKIRMCQNNMKKYILSIHTASCFKRWAIASLSISSSAILSTSIKEIYLIVHLKKHKMHSHFYNGQIRNSIFTKWTFMVKVHTIVQVTRED